MTTPTWCINNLDIALARIMIYVYALTPSPLFACQNGGWGSRSPAMTDGDDRGISQLHVLIRLTVYLTTTTLANKEWEMWLFQVLIWLNKQKRDQ